MLTETALLPSLLLKFLSSSSPPPPPHPTPSVFDSTQGLYAKLFLVTFPGIKIERHLHFEDGLP